MHRWISRRFVRYLRAQGWVVNEDLDWLLWPTTIGSVIDRIGMKQGGRRWLLYLVVPGFVLSLLGPYCLFVSSIIVCTVDSS